MIDDLSQFGARVGPLVYVPLLAVAIGLAVFLWTLWDFVTGGPRALKKPDKPYLYSRFYFLLQLIHVAGWTFAPTAFLIDTVPHIYRDRGTLILLALVPVFTASGLQLLFGGDMMNRAAKYLAESGAWWQRPFYRMWSIRYDFYHPFSPKLTAASYIIGGLCVLIFNLPHLHDALEQVPIGCTAITDLFFGGTG